jgi:hypothetical protein
MWESFLIAILHNEPFINLAGILFLACYVYFTYITFKEIQKQTEIQSEAFIIVTSTICPQKDSTLNRISTESEQLYNKWHDILTNNAKDTITGKTFLHVNLKNRGKSDVIWWRLKIQALIEPGLYLEKKINANGENKELIIEQSNSDDIISTEEEICLCAIGVDAFPKAIFKWELEYKDMRKRTYKTFSGDTNKTTTNALVYELHPEEVT